MIPYYITVSQNDQWQMNVAHLQKRIQELWTDARFNPPGNPNSPLSWDIVFSSLQNPYTSSFVTGHITENGRDVVMIGDFARIIDFIYLYRLLVPPSCHLFFREMIGERGIAIRYNMPRTEIYKFFDRTIDHFAIELLHTIQQHGGYMQLQTLLEAQGIHILHLSEDDKQRAINAVNTLWSGELISCSGTRWMIQKPATILDDLNPSLGTFEFGMTPEGRRLLHIREYLQDQT